MNAFHLNNLLHLCEIEHNPNTSSSIVQIHKKFSWDQVQENMEESEKTLLLMTHLWILDLNGLDLCC